MNVVGFFLLLLFSEQSTAFPCVCSIVKARVIHKIISGYGKIEPYRKFIYKAPVSGKIEFLPFSSGSPVKKGQTIIKITDSSTIFAYKEALQEYRTLESLKNSGFLPVNYYKKRAELAKLKEKLRLMNFKAPFNGFIANLRVKAGDYVEKGEELFEIIQNDSFLVGIWLPVYKIKDIKPGEEVEINLPDSTLLKGKVWGWDLKNDRLKVLVIFHAHHKVLPGIFVEAKIYKPLKVAKITVPRNALIKEGERYHVFKIQNHYAKWVYVKPGVWGDDYVEILEGNLSPGDSVIIKGKTFLGHNVKVKVVKCIK